MISSALHRRLALLWLLTVAILLGALAWLLPRAQLETDIMALLPHEDTAAFPPGLAEACVQRLNRQLVWAVSSAPNDTTPGLAQWWFAELQKIPGLENLSGPISSADQSAWADFLFRHRAQLLDHEAAARLQHQPTAWAQWVLAQTYSPFAGVSAVELQNDPLLLVRTRQLQLQAQAAPLSLAGGWLSATEADGRDWRLIYGELHASSFDVTALRETVEKLDALRDEFSRRWPDAQLLQRGAAFYSAHAAAQAESDLARLGTLSSIGVTLLILLFFRSLLPIFLTLLSTGVGTLTGVVAQLLLFNSVHLVALVLSTSIIGVAVDYALHYLTECMMRDPDETPFASLRKLFPALSLALITSSLAYLALLLAPFPGFHQLAAYAVFGLTGAFLTVVLWFPFLVRNLPRRSPHGLALAQGWLRLWQNHRWLRFSFPAVIAVVGTTGLFRLQIDDDVARLQGFPPSFRQTEEKLAALTGQSADMNWFVVHGNSAENVLQKLETLGARLRLFQEENTIGSFRLLSDQLPSLRQQQETHQIISSAAPQVTAVLRDAELPVTATPVPTFSPVTVAEWQRSPVSRGWNLLWFDLPDASSAALVPVGGVRDHTPLVALAEEIPGTLWLNRRAQLTDLFALHRQHLGQLLGVAALAVTGIFLLRFGWRRGLVNTIPVLLALGTGVGMLAFTGQPLNLFALLALVLVLGIGIDYTLFFANDACAPSTAMLSVCIDTATTALSFGMLALSTTPAIAGFGVVLTAGIVTAFLLAPLTRPAFSSAPRKLPPPFSP